jgi:hypothetical protein
MDILTSNTLYADLNNLQFKSEYNINAEITLENLNKNREEIISFLFANHLNKELIISFYKDMFKLRGSFLKNLQNGILIDEYMYKDDIIIVLLALLESIYNQNSYTETIFNYIPSNYYIFNNMIRFIYNNYGNNYNFYDLGSGIPIKTLIAQEYGFKSKGFEISKEILGITNKLGLSDLVEKKDIINLELISPKIIYYYNPFYKEKDMSKFEDDLISEMKAGDILFRIVINDVNRYIGLDLEKNEFLSNSLFLKDFGTEPKLNTLKFTHKIKTDGSFYSSIWIKD